MNFKSVLGAAIFVLVTSAISFSIFVQTKTFGRVLTKVINDFAEKKISTKIGLQSVRVSVFPPGIELNRVKIDKKIDESSSFNAEFGKLGFYIGFIEFEEWKLTLGEIKISDSVVNYSYLPNENVEIKEIDRFVIDAIFEADKGLPIRVDTVLIENSKLIANHDVLDAKKLKIFKKGKSFMARFHIANIKPKDKSDWSLDEVWGDAEIDRKNINVHRLKVQHDVHSLLLKGKIINYPSLKMADYDLAGEGNFYLGNLQELGIIPSRFEFKSGLAIANFKLKKNKDFIDGNIDFAVNDLKSNIAYAEQILISSTFENNQLYVNKINFKYKDQKAHLISPVLIANFQNNRYFQNELKFNVENLRIGNALRFLPSLKPIKGYLSGEVNFKYDGNYHFNLGDGFEAKRLGLVVGEKTKIIMVKKATLSDAYFGIVDDEFQMRSLLELANSKIELSGYVNSRTTGFTAQNAKVDLEDLGNISNLDVKGKGSLNLVVDGPIDDVKINLEGKMDRFEILGYRLGKSDLDLSILLKDSKVLINKIESIVRSTSLSGSGEINYGNGDIALGINSPKASFVDLNDVLNPIFSKMDFLPEDMNMTAQIDANIYGKTAVDQIKVKSNVNFSDLIAYGESVNQGSFDIKFENQLLEISKLKAKKGKGRILGDFSYSMKSQNVEMDYSWDKLSIATFNIPKKLKINLNGFMSGTLIGSGKTKDYKLKVQNILSETTAGDFQFEDSQFLFNISPSSVEGVGDFLKIVNLKFNYSLDNSTFSKIQLKVDAPSIKPFATVMIGRHLENEVFSGELALTLDAKFKHDFKDMNLVSNLEKFVFKYEAFDMNYHSVQPQFLIENNKVKAWNLSINEPNLKINSRGRGEFGEKVILEQDLYIDSKILELFLSPVLSSEGMLQNSMRIDGIKNHYILTLSSKSRGMSLMLDGLSFPLNNLDYDIDMTGNRINIREVKTSLENGSVNLKGDIYLDSFEPDVNIKYWLDKAEIPILGKSFMNLSGEGTIFGNNFPYNLNGEIVVNKAQVVNEINEFGQKDSSLSNIRYLPQGQDSLLGKLLNLNVNVKIDNPVRVSNSLMDLGLKGEIRLLGSPTRIRGEGRIYSPPNSSRIFFKSNEYTITNADLNFTPRKIITNPDFDIQAITFISNYKINSKAYGDLERFNFDLTSEPALPKNSILSLIAFGYTDEIQNSLRQEDQQNLTQVGVGSFVFDRFKISDILNKQFGLQINLGTVFEQSQESLITSRAADGQTTGAGRTRSATKIELKKRLSEAMTLSVSSTMGGSIGQRQSMNLNYGISKNVQAEGIYELRTNEDETGDRIDNSIGADLKFRWTFR